MEFNFDREVFLNTPLSPATYSGAPAFLYLMECEHFVKVGIATNTQARRAELQRSNPFKIRILWSKKFEFKMFAMIAERAVHRALGDWRHAGEWFTVSPEQARAAISMVCAEMPALMIKHKELDYQRRVALAVRHEMGQRRRNYTPEEDEAWQRRKAQVIADLFPSA